MRKNGFIGTVFTGLLMVFLISFAAACSREGRETLTEGEETQAGATSAAACRDDAMQEMQEGEGKREEAASSEDSGEEGGSAGAPPFEETSSEDPGEEVSGNDISGNSVSEDRVPAGAFLRRSGVSAAGISGSGLSGSGISGNGLSGNHISGNSLPGNHGSGTSEGGVSGNHTSGNGTWEEENGASVPAGNMGERAGLSESGGKGRRAGLSRDEGRESGYAVSGNGVSGDTVTGNGVSGNTDPGNTVSENTVSGNGVSENTISGNNVSGNTLSGNSISGNGIPFSLSGNAILTLAQRQKVRSSHKETILANEKDRATISGNCLDFTEIRIACLGDSITEGSNLDRLENYKELAYPAALEDALDAEEVYNLGIGGSSIGRYWADAFVDRYREIPEDTDLILVMGGTNDGFCASLVEFGTPTERKKRTFWGDLDELMEGLKKDYPDAEIIFLTPLPNSLQDYLKKDHPYLISQEKYAEVIRQLAKEHGIEVIDLYNSNILDGHDKDNALHLMPDGVHPNAEGYRILGEHVAAEIIRLLEQRREERIAAASETEGGN